MADVTFILTPDPKVATVTLIAGTKKVTGVGAQQITIPTGTKVKWTVAYEQCTTQQDEEIVRANTNKSVSLKYIGAVTANTWIPSTSKEEGTYPTHLANLGKGGWQQVETIAERDLINNIRLSVGMAVYVNSENKLYIYKGTKEDPETHVVSKVWEEFVSGSGGTWGTITGNLADQTDLNTTLVDLQTQIDSLSARGKLLSIWNAIEGLPTSDPTDNPYIYQTGDYYIVGFVNTDGQNNYKPIGTQYEAGVASTTIEEQSLNVDDTYYFDGNTWVLIKNSSKEVSFANISGQPSDNTALSQVLNNKANTSDIHDGTLTIKKNNESLGTFTANQSTNTDLNIEFLPSEIEYTFSGVSSVTSVQDALDILMNKQFYANPTASLKTTNDSPTTATEFEIGQTSTGIKLVWTVSKAVDLTVDSLKLSLGSTVKSNIITDNPEGAAARTGTWEDSTVVFAAKNNAYTEYKYTVEYVDNHSTVPSGSSYTNKASASRSIVFKPRFYWGALSTDTITDAQILNELSSKLDTTRNRKIVFNCTGGKYPYYVIPTAYASGMAWKDGPNDFTDYTTETRDIINSHGAKINYTICKVTNLLKGSDVTYTIS